MEVKEAEKCISDMISCQKSVECLGNTIADLKTKLAEKTTQLESIQKDYSDQVRVIQSLSEAIQMQKSNFQKDLTNVQNEVSQFIRKLIFFLC